MYLSQHKQTLYKKSSLFITNGEERAKFLAILII